MGFKFTEKDLINNNIFKYEEKLNSQYTRFLEQTPTYVTYYNINTIESTVDLGFSNVEKILGKGSPIRYSEIKNLPIYGLEQIQMSIEEIEAGLSSSYDGDFIMLPDTVHPYPDDFFIIDHKGFDFLFRVTGVDYDTIKSNNFYKVEFTVKYVTKEESLKILDQVNEKYTCVVENIGTQDRCIIEDEQYALLMRMKDLYNELAERYKLFFYKKRYNSFVFGETSTKFIYDRYISHFIQKHGLLYDAETHRTIYLNNEDESCCFTIEYDQSIFRTYELRKLNRVKVYPNKYTLTDIKYIYSIFKYYRRKDVFSVRFIDGNKDYLHNPLFKAITTGNLELSTPDQDADPNVKLDEADKIIVKYLYDQIDSIYNFNLDDLEEFIYFYPSWENFVKIPLLLYAMKGYYKLFTQKQSNN